MKTISHIFFKLFILSVFLFPMDLSAGENQSEGNEPIHGTWLGELVIPHQASLRMGIIITLNDDKTQKAVLNIIDQSTGDIPCDEVLVRNDTVTVRLKKLGIEISGPMAAESREINGRFRQAGANFPIVFKPVDKLPEILRPQEPKGPFPYQSEEVVFENTKAGVRLAGTITIPQKPGKFPAVIMVTGSGKQNRDEEFAKHKPFWVIADYLTRQGIIVLRVDDRGCGASTGSFEQSTTGDFAEDVLSGIAYLKGRKEVNPQEIGIIGHSDGGIVASLAAAQSTDVAYIVTLAGLMESFEKAVLDQLMNQAAQQGKSAEDIELERNWRKSIYSIAKEKTDVATATTRLWEIYNALPEADVKRLNWPKGRHESQINQVLNPWWRFNLSLNNEEAIKNIQCPVLALYGSLDQQVRPEQNVSFVEAAFKKGTNPHAEVKVLPGLNHMFQTATTGSEYEYFRIEETISPEVLNLMATWIGKQVSAN
ncbi:MAG TPA: alpha/beta fold hydrolase [Prolixibacteraceae bacterium]|nr:alpha/beta fold hydrolase [Prolixibacteraceae bacterium]